MSINRTHIIAGALVAGVIMPLANESVSFANEIKTTTANVNFRTGPGTNYSSMQVISKGVKVEVISTSGNWSNVKYNSKTGYISSQYLSTTNSSDSSTSTTMYVTATSLNVRSGAGTNYSVVGNLKKGATVKVSSTSNGWSKITSGNVSGYVSTQYLSSTNPSGGSTSEDSNSSTSTTMYVTATSLNVRSGAGTNYSVVGNLKKGATVKVSSTSNGWSKITSGNVSGYVSTQYLSATNSSSGSNNSGNSTSASKVISYAQTLLGKSYVWGAQGPNSFDCSGFTVYVYKNAAGVSLPRTSSSQSTYGTTISKSNLQVGDLLFFDTSGVNNGAVSHVGIYMGNNQMIHSSSGQGKVVTTNINTTYWNNAYVRAKRVL